MMFGKTCGFLSSCIWAMWYLRVAFLVNFLKHRWHWNCGSLLHSYLKCWRTPWMYLYLLKHLVQMYISLANCRKPKRTHTVEWKELHVLYFTTYVANKRNTVFILEHYCEMMLICMMKFQLLWILCTRYIVKATGIKITDYGTVFLEWRKTVCLFLISRRKITFLHFSTNKLLSMDNLAGLQMFHVNPEYVKF